MKQFSRHISFLAVSLLAVAAVVSGVAQPVSAERGRGSEGTTSTETTATVKTESETTTESSSPGSGSSKLSSTTKTESESESESSTEDTHISGADSLRDRAEKKGR